MPRLTFTCLHLVVTVQTANGRPLTCKCLHPASLCLLVLLLVVQTYVLLLCLHISRMHHSCVFSRPTRKWRLASRTAFSVASELRLTNPLEAISEVPIPPFGESHCHQKSFLSSNLLSFFFILGTLRILRV